MDAQIYVEVSNLLHWQEIAQRQIEHLYHLLDQAGIRAEETEEGEADEQ